MKITAQLRQQHDELLVLATEVGSGLDVTRLAASEAACREPLQRLLGKLNVHLAVEDKILYPALLAHERADVARTARAFTDEMGMLGKSVKEFAARWEAAGSIQGRPLAFVGDCRAILEALELRIVRENSVLYALAEEIGL